MFKHVKTFVKIILRFRTEELGVIEDTVICKVGVFRDLTQFGEA